MKYLIIGLGNPGFEYENTRHNIGFKIIDDLVESTSFLDDRYAKINHLKYKGRTATLVKPNTFMNLSGKAVNYWKQKLNVSCQNTLIITDDISLPFGTLRMRGKGSDGGHNGLKSIQDALKRNDFPRLRFGIGNNFSKGKQAEYVLSNFSDLELSLLKERIEAAIAMIKSFLAIGIEQTMSNLNGK